MRQTVTTQQFGQKRAQHRRWVAIAFGTLILGGVVGCSPRLKTEDIATQIYDELSQQEDVDLETVICPPQVEPEVGQVFRCAGRLDQGTIFVITVEQIDEAGAVAWDVPHSKGLINLSKLETYFTQAIGQSLGEFPTIDCGGQFRLNREGERFDCTVDGNIIVNERRLETIQVKLDSLGNVNWQQVRNLVPEEELLEVEEGTSDGSFIEEEA